MVATGVHSVRRNDNMELPGVTFYVWATGMEKAIIELAGGRYYASRKEAISKTPKILVATPHLRLWEIIIRREPKQENS